MSNKFNHSQDEKKAEEYLKSISMYDKVISSELGKVIIERGGHGMMMIIAANEEYKKRQ
jgi:hypothetical protein